MPDEKDVYAAHGEQYDRLVSREDYRRNILPALQQICPLAGRDVADLGAGTGRISRLLAPLVNHVTLLDSSAHMLDVAAARLRGDGLRNWEIQVADHRVLPLGENTVDLVISGWSLGYLVVWDEDGLWRKALRRALSEMRRVLRPGGTIVVLETLGTGHETPHRLEKLDAYFGFLEEAGFASTWIRTDYRFASLDEEEELTRFFFGDELAEQVLDHGQLTLPECTGVWWLHV
jgi:ubiquinone/menaquinone biosynthesis C-methylase UbiE